MKPAICQLLSRSKSIGGGVLLESQQKSAAVDDVVLENCDSFFEKRKVPYHNCISS
jgi:hypothetical protein